jgi:hypothetical protein
MKNTNYYSETTKKLLITIVLSVSRQLVDLILGSKLLQNGGSNCRYTPITGVGEKWPINILRVRIAAKPRVYAYVKVEKPQKIVICFYKPLTVNTYRHYSTIKTYCNNLNIVICCCNSVVPTGLRHYSKSTKRPLLQKLKFY